MKHSNFSSEFLSNRNYVTAKDVIVSGFIDLVKNIPSFCEMDHNG